MAKNIFVSSRNGKISYFLMMIGVTGVVLEYAVLHLYLEPLAGSDTMMLAYLFLGTLALVSGVLAILLAIFKIPKWIWIMLSSFVLIFTILPPAIMGGMLGFFPYVLGDTFHTRWMFLPSLPARPAIDFIGFWMAVGGGLLSMISGFFVPKK